MNRRPGLLATPVHRGLEAPPAVLLGGLAVVTAAVLAVSSTTWRGDPDRGQQR